MDAKYLTQDPLNVGVFVIDDNGDVLEQVKEVIEQSGITNYHLYKDEQKFIDGLTNQIHLFILDHTLTIKSGLDVLKAIKEKNDFSYVIAYTGTRNPDIIEAYLNGGCNKFVNKNKNHHLEQLTQFLKEGLQVAKKNVDFDNFLKQELVRKQHTATEMVGAP